jgi:nanoRNase/pAp phosphatase (c-di-AMP/oligoRNAs hydrolase)
MFYRLYVLSDMAKITELRGNEISPQDLNLYAEAFRTVEIYDEIGFFRLTSTSDSLLGASGDIILSVSGVNIVVAYALRDAGIKLSVRSICREVKANDLVRSLTEGIGVGGGHDHMAGGFIPHEKLGEQRSIDTFLKYRTIAFYEKAKKLNA